jgi:Lhr-like helicase
VLHPISALENVCEEYRAYLLNEFRAKDPGLRQALDQEIDRPGFLSQEPFYQAHRPFVTGDRWTDLPLDPRLARALVARAHTDYTHLHQSQAINHLLGPSAGPLVVTTGTGSGKTECFLAPVIQNAIEDATAFRKDGLTALLVYPMNALANDQEERVRQYLAAAGWEGAVHVARYDRQTTQEERERLRRRPPHILLTNYMMLEYLLVRPADRDSIFENHRCRFLVLDEVHTYRGALGTNIALLIRRAMAHLQGAQQDWMPHPSPGLEGRRFPGLICVGTSATIRTVDEAGLPREEVRRLRDEAVQQFFGRLTGAPCQSIRVIGEELRSIEIPADAVYATAPPACGATNVSDPSSVSAGLNALSGAPDGTTLEEAARRARLLWDLNDWLMRRPMSLSAIVDRVQVQVPGRSAWSRDDVQREVETALSCGAALPEGIAGALRLRAHRLFRGGWRFHRCVSPTCGRLYPRGEQYCTCGGPTAPLYLCRNCGADYLRLVGDPNTGTLRASADHTEQPEYMVYEPGRFEVTVDEEDGEEENGIEAPAARRRVATRVRGRNVLTGSLDPTTLAFSEGTADYSLNVLLVPGRTRCMCCGGTAGSRSVITPVALGTSAAVKVLAEGLVESLHDARDDGERDDDKERLLVFSDSRQDAAHQARFIVYASRYDRMRRRLYRMLQEQSSLSLQRAVELLGNEAEREGGSANPEVPPDRNQYISSSLRERIRAWEEAPLLDDIAVTAGYRGTLINLGLVQVEYEELGDYIAQRGGDLCGTLGISAEQLAYLCRCVLDEMRIRGALNREMLRYHPANGRRPDWMNAAQWERRIKQPQGYPLDDRGEPTGYRPTTEVPSGIILKNACRAEGRGRRPAIERIVASLQAGFGGIEPNIDHVVELLVFLRRGGFVTPTELFGYREGHRLLQVESGHLRLAIADAGSRRRCSVCGRPAHGGPIGAPCSACHGRLEAWPDCEVETVRAVTRIRAPEVVPLVAAEHTAQVPGDVRKELEDEFKAAGNVSTTNLLACSPTLEMGIDVGGLDAVLLRNVPPRPDNYAQRGGRAGRRSRVGLVVGYARNTPHDQYFYENPVEMIAGEVPAPPLNLANRDTIVRHLFAIAFGSADPGLAGKMVDYVNAQGGVQQETVDALIQAVRAQFGHALDLAEQAWRDDVLIESGLSRDDLLAQLQGLDARIQRVVDLTARQVTELRRDIETYATMLQGEKPAARNRRLILRILGMESEEGRGRQQADDRSAGYPLRRFAEFGILPGYEFPSEPATVRLLGDDREDDPVSTVRRFGIGQFQPHAVVFARGRRWKVTGLDLTSPWNPPADAGLWSYRVCTVCTLRYASDQPRCPRCGALEPGQPCEGRELGGFIAMRDEAPVFDEEDRIPVANLVQPWPQWNGRVTGRWSVAGGWSLRLAVNEDVRWLNEGRAPTDADRTGGVPLLHETALGHPLCAVCGRILSVPADEDNGHNPRRQPRRSGQQPDPYGHAPNCSEVGSAPHPMALVAKGICDTLRLIVPVPDNASPPEWMTWGLSLGYALREGLCRLYMLDDPEVEFILENPWEQRDASGATVRIISLTFIDPALGGAGFLPRAAAEFHLVAGRALAHLGHTDCDTACYRCLKDYRNQRYHQWLAWHLTTGPLEALASAVPESHALSARDVDDPRAWLDAYAAGVGSPLELRFLRLFEANGVAVEKQVPVAPTDGDRAISIADFVLNGRRVAIFIDGAAYHVGQRLRRDRAIRQRLSDGSQPWRVVAFTAADLANTARVLETLRE